MTSLFSTRAVSDDSSALRLAPVAPDDAALLPLGVCRAIFVGEEGDLAVEDASGGRATLASGSSQYHPIRIRRVFATGTTASGIIALY